MALPLPQTSTASLFVNRLKLQNFRSYTEQQVEFDRKINFILGENGIGKSNLLEALGMFSQLKSFRSVKDADLLHFGHDHYFLELAYTRDSQDHQLQIGFQTTQKGSQRRFRIDGAKTPMNSFLGHFLAVFFVPGDLSIVEGGMVERRRYMDLILSQGDSQYFKAIVEYNRLLRQRNALLKRIREHRENSAALDAWDEQLLLRCRYVTEKRSAFISSLADILNRYVETLSRGNEEYRLEYEPSLDRFDAEEFTKSRMADIASGRTTRGAHLDKLYFYFKTGSADSGRDVLDVASQGQKRTLVLSLRMAQYEYLKGQTAINPVILIDDVITELDARRRYFFIELLQKSGQAFFTTTSLRDHNEIIEAFQGDLASYSITEKGTVNRDQV